MERELYLSLYRIVYDLARASRTKHVIFPDRLIVMTYFWAVLHDRPIAWACQPSHWPRGAANMELPSASTMSRRLRREEVLKLIQRVEHVLAGGLEQSSLCFIDAKPLPVGHASNDRQALSGYAGGRVCKGYKLHVILDVSGVVRSWQVQPMRPREAQVAPLLIEQLQGTGTLVGDNAYDANKLYDQAGRRGWQLVAWRRAGTDLGHQAHSPWRLRAHRKLDPMQRQMLYHQRGAIERFFGRLGNQTGGLGPLPNNVRTLRRVRLWVQAKLILYHLRLLQKTRIKAA